MAVLGCGESRDDERIISPELNIRAIAQMVTVPPCGSAVSVPLAYENTNCRLPRRRDLPRSYGASQQGSVGS